MSSADGIFHRGSISLRNCHIGVFAVAIVGIISDTHGLLRRVLRRPPISLSDRGRRSGLSGASETLVSTETARPGLSGLRTAFNGSLKRVFF